MPSATVNTCQLQSPNWRKITTDYAFLATRIFNMHLMAPNSKHVHFPSWKWTCLQIFDWLQKTLTSSIVQIKPSGGSLLTLYSTLQHRQMMQRKTFQEYHTSMTKHRLKLCEWNTISIFDLVLRTSSRIPVELKKSKWHTHSSLLKGYHFRATFGPHRRPAHAKLDSIDFPPKNGPESRTYGISCLRSLAPMWRGDCDAGSHRTWRIADQLVC